ncbi:MAG: hypothetical protein ACOYM3_09390 [Terrimicrobiaceae bacterium]
MTATTQAEDMGFHREAIALPLLRPVSKPASVPLSAQEPPPGAVPPPAPSAPSSPPAVQSVQKLNLDLLSSGDKLVVRTANSTYNFEMGEQLHCKVVPGKSTARTGEAILMGGTNADTSEYTPERVFVGGRLAYQFPDEESAILTSAVESIFWVQAKKPAQS